MVVRLRKWHLLNVVPLSSPSRSWSVSFSCCCILNLTAIIYCKKASLFIKKDVLAKVLPWLPCKQPFNGLAVLYRSKDSWNKFKCFLQYQYTKQKGCKQKKASVISCLVVVNVAFILAMCWKKSLLYKEFAHCAEIVVLMGRLRRFFSSNPLRGIQSFIKTTFSGFLADYRTDHES